MFTAILLSCWERKLFWISRFANPREQPLCHTSKTFRFWDFRDFRELAVAAPAMLENVE
jgi:hypothetical protein